MSRIEILVELLHNRECVERTRKLPGQMNAFLERGSNRLRIFTFAFKQVEQCDGEGTWFRIGRKLGYQAESLSRVIILYHTNTIQDLNSLGFLLRFKDIR